jgi:hypothetical protein
MGPRSWWRSPMGSARPPTAGRNCCATLGAVACARRWWWLVTARWGCGRRCGTSSPPPATSATGSTSSPTCLPACPRPARAGARKALAEIRDAPDRDHACRAIEAFARDYGVKWPKAAAKITEDAEELLTFFDFPAEHWQHLKTSNPIESTFSSVRLRTRVTKGPGSKAAGLAMAFKLLESAQQRWRAVNGPHLVALVRAGAQFDKGVMLERPDDVQEVAA